MKSQDLLTQFPEKFFSDKFKEKEDAIRGIGAPYDQIETKKTEYDKFYYFDELLKKLKSKLQENTEREIDKYISSRISFLLSQLASLISYLENLNYSEPQNVNRIFENFQNNVNYLFQMIKHNIDVGGISTGRQVIDEYIKEVQDIIESLESYKVDQQEIKEAEKIAKQLIKNSGKYEEAIKTAENWIKAEGVALGSSLKDRSEIFNNKANQEHRTKYIWGWFLGGILGGLVALVVILVFIFKNGVDITIGSALLRISTIVVISYFSFFCIQQFSNHRKLYEIYKFKAIALKTMEELIKSYQDTSDRERILNKAISIIFSEPQLSEDKHIQKKVIEDLIEIVKKKF